MGSFSRIRRAYTQSVSYSEILGREVATTSLPSTVAASGSDSTVTAPVAHRSSSSFPTSEKILIAFIVVIGVVISALVIWRFSVWRARRAVAASTMVNVAVMEKQHDTKVAPLVTLTDVPLSEKSAVEHTVQLPILPMPSLPRSTFSKRLTHLPGLKRLVGKNSDHILPVADDFDLRSPPPSYAFVDISPTAQSGSQASFRPQISISVHPPSSHGSLSIAKSNLAIESPVIASPIRTSSFGPYNLSPATPKTKAALPTEKLPRLMVVDNTFQPNLPDELTIHVGETLQMMAEYEDEWCLVQRVGGLGGELGVIPRFCLRECSES